MPKKKYTPTFKAKIVISIIQLFNEKKSLPKFVLKTILIPIWYTSGSRSSSTMPILLSV